MFPLHLLLLNSSQKNILSLLDYSLRFQINLSFTSCIFLHRHLLPIGHSLNVIFFRVPLLDLSQQPRPRLRPAGSRAATGVESRPLVQLLLRLPTGGLFMVLRRYPPVSRQAGKLARINNLWPVKELRRRLHR